MPSNLDFKGANRLLFKCRQFCHLSIGGLFLASSFTGTLPAAFATSTFVIPDAAPAAQPVTPSRPAPAAKAPAPKPKLAAPPAQRKPVVKQAAPAPRKVATPTQPAAPKPKPQKLAAPKITTPAPVTVQPTQIRQGLQKNQYIDAAPHRAASSPPSTQPAAPSSVVIKSRQNNCQTVVSGGSLQRGCGGTSGTITTTQPAVARQAAVAAAKPITPRRQQLATRPAQPTAPRSGLKPIATNQVTRAAASIGLPIGSNQVFSLEPIANRGIEIALAPLPEYTRTSNLYAAAPQNSGQQQSTGTDLMFPVAAVSPITSAFGWRTHPITGQARQHNGTDIGAPMGTPVVAAYAGKVVAAQWSGGYGLMITLRHLDGTQESRYAHLSEVFVEPGQEIQQGEIIGRIGSTGMSTGPHLHFEWRHLTNDGWVAVDAGPHLQMALESLMRAQQVAQTVTVKQDS